MSGKEKNKRTSSKKGSFDPRADYFTGKPTSRPSDIRKKYKESTDKISAPKDMLSVKKAKEKIRSEGFLITTVVVQTAQEKEDALNAAFAKIKTGQDKKTRPGMGLASFMNWADEPAAKFSGAKIRKIASAENIKEVSQDVRQDVAVETVAVATVSGNHLKFDN